MGGWGQDLRISARTLLRQWRFTAVVALTLSLGIGANTAIFTLVYAVMLKSLPVEKPEQLYRLGDDDNCCVVTGLQDKFSLFSYQLYRHLRDNTPEFTELAAFQAQPGTLSVRRTGDSELASPARGQFVSGNYFTMFGVSAFAGRLLRPGDDDPAAAPVAVMSYQVWTQQFGGDPSVIGAAFTLNGRPVTVVGVTAPGFFGDTVRERPADLWMPLGSEPALRGESSILEQPTSHWLYAIGRLQSGAHPIEAETRVTTELRAWLMSQHFPARYDARIARERIVVAPAGAGVGLMRLNYTAALSVLFVVSGLVLLVACANVANLLLARVNAAQTAVRRALGAPRLRLIRAALTEGTLLAVAGGIAGVLVAYLGTRAILALAFAGSSGLPIDARPSLAVLGFACGLSVLTGVVFSTAPAVIMSRTDPAAALYGIGRSTRDRSLVPRRLLVIVQVALSFVLLFGSGLLTKSLGNLEHQPFGYDTDHLVLATVDPVLAGYAPAGLDALYREMQTRLATLPGVRSVGLSLYGPMSGDNWSSGISIAGRPVDPDHRDSASWDRVSTTYFQTVGTPLRRGRLFGAADSPTAHRVAIVNESFATRFFPTGDPIGHYVGLGDASHANDFEIVGEVADAKYADAQDPPRPMFFLPLLQTVAYPDVSNTSMQARSSYIHEIELRVAGGPDGLESQLRRALGAINPNLVVLNVTAFNDRVAQSVGQERLIARLMLVYGVIALLLASVGLYGVTAQTVRRRTREIGIRMALGAAPSGVILMVLRGALVQVGLGLAIGLPVSFAAGRGLAQQLYGVGLADPLMLNGAALALVLAATLAATVAARQAASIDPIHALRAD
jgi:predicted permease